MMSDKATLKMKREAEQFHKRLSDAYEFSLRPDFRWGHIWQKTIAFVDACDGTCTGGRHLFNKLFTMLIAIEIESVLTSAAASGTPFSPDSGKPPNTYNLAVSMLSRYRCVVDAASPPGEANSMFVTAIGDAMGAAFMIVVMSGTEAQDSFSKAYRELMQPLLINLQLGHYTNLNLAPAKRLSGLDKPWLFKPYWSAYDG
jgi:hypothetical protein